MNRARQLSVLTLANLALITLAAFRTPVYPGLPLEHGRVPSPTRVDSVLGIDSLHELAAVIAFSERFDFPKPPEVPAATPPVAVTPSPEEQVVVTALAGGPPWIAVLATQGGRAASSLVRAGDTLASLRVIDVSANGVRVTNGDSSWTIPLGRTQR